METRGWWTGSSFVATVSRCERGAMCAESFPRSGGCEAAASMLWSCSKQGLWAALAFGRLLVEAVEARVTGAAALRGVSAMPKTNRCLPRANRHSCLSSDEEGRLTLADALAYAADLPGVDHIVELSTLTGAAIAALGKSIGALLTPDDALAESLQASATAAGEPLWRLPLYAPYTASLDSPLADVSNMGTKGGVGAGAVTAGLFLDHFVRPGVAWAHVDIAGPAAAWDQGSGTGATGYGVATLVHWVHAHGATETSRVERSG